MRILLLFGLVIASVCAVEVVVPEDQDLMIYFPTIEDSMSVTISPVDVVSVLSDKFQTRALAVDKAVALALRAKVFSVLAGYKANSANAGGEGYANLVVTNGMASNSVAVTYAWNESKGIPMPPDAKTIRDGVSDLIASAKK